MKVRADKFIARVMDECYDRDNHGFTLTKLLEKHNIPFEDDDRVYMFTDYVDGKFTGYPLKDMKPSIRLYQMLEYWDEYMKNPVKGTIIFNWVIDYVLPKFRTIGFIKSKKGRRIPVREKYLEPASEKATVVDHLYLFLKKKDNSIKKYTIFLEAKSEKTRTMKPNTVEPCFYSFHIKEEAM